MKSLVVVGAAVLMLGACNDPGFRGVPEVRTATEAEVANCRFLATVSVEPGVYGPVLAEEGLRYARNKVMESARDSGADTVVFDPVEPGAPVYLVKARAYACSAGG